MSTLHKINPNVCDAPTRTVDVVFIHGLGGHPFDTWSCDINGAKHWPAWVAQQFPTQGVAVWSLEYAAPVSDFFQRLKQFFGNKQAKTAMRLDQRAQDCLAQLSASKFGSRPTYFVCHSLGGLLAKQMLLESQQPASKEGVGKALANVRAITFLGTPHRGSLIANEVVAEFKPLASQAVHDLQYWNQKLHTLEQQFVAIATRSQIKVRSYYETECVRGAVKIVEEHSAWAGVGESVPCGEDHFGISKPSSQDEERVLHVRSVVESLLGSKGVSADPSISVLPTKIPFQPPPKNPHFVGRTKEQAELRALLNTHQHVYVVGQGGFGKTALAAKVLEDHFGGTAGQWVTSRYSDGLIFVDFYQRSPTRPAAWQQIASALGTPLAEDGQDGGDQILNLTQGKKLLVVFEGAERLTSAELRELLSKLSPEVAVLVLTRDINQTTHQPALKLSEKLTQADVVALLNALTQDTLRPEVIDAIARFLDGHPLAAVWAGGHLSNNTDDPLRWLDEWKSSNGAKLFDPRDVTHDLPWLYEQSAGALSDDAQRMLATAALFAPVPVSATQLESVFNDAFGSSGQHALRELCGRHLMTVTLDEKRAFAHAFTYQFSRTRALGLAYARAAVPAALRSAVPALNSARDQLSPDTPHQQQALETCAHVSAIVAAIEEQDTPQRQPIVRSLGFELQAGFNEIAQTGDQLATLGSLRNAATAHGAAHACAQKLNRYDPGDTNWQRDLSVSYNKIGDIYIAQGNLEAALTQFTEGLNIAKTLAASDPSNSQWQRDLFVSYAKLMQVEADRGEMPQARAWGEKAKQVAERLAKLDPTNAQWQQDVVIIDNALRALDG